jgi:hypothetical protein
MTKGNKIWPVLVAAVVEISCLPTLGLYASTPGNNSPSSDLTSTPSSTPPSSTPSSDKPAPKAPAQPSDNPRIPPFITQPTGPIIPNEPRSYPAPSNPNRPADNFTAKIKIPSEQPIVPVQPRSKLLFNFKKYGYRSSKISSTSPSLPPKESEQSLALRSQVDEASNDAMQATYDNKNDSMLLNAQNQLFNKISALQSTNAAVSKQEYNDNLATRNHIQVRTRESSATIREFELEIKINAIKFAKARGEDFKLIILARAYADLWQARWDKYLALSGEAQADRDYYASVLAQVGELYRTKNISEADLIRAQRDFDQAAITLDLANRLAEESKNHLDEFRKIVSAP